MLEPFSYSMSWLRAADGKFGGAVTYLCDWHPVGLKRIINMLKPHRNVLVLAWNCDGIQWNVRIPRRLAAGIHTGGTQVATAEVG